MNLYNLLPSVLVYVPECPDMIVVDHIRAAAKLLCEHGAWRYEFDPLDAAANTPDYQLDLPPASKVHSIVSVLYSGTPLTAASTEKLDGSTPNWRTHTGPPNNYYFNGDDTVYLAPMPSVSVASSIIVTAQLMPSRTAAVLDDVLVERYEKDIMNGALATLLALPGAWRDVTLAGVYDHEFTMACNRVRSASFNQYANVRLRARSPYTFG
jgi:hypothetical protein